MITDFELPQRLVARVETSNIIKPQDMQMARSVVELLVPMVLKIIQEEVKAGQPKSGKEE